MKTNSSIFYILLFSSIISNIAFGQDHSFYKLSFDKNKCVTDVAFDSSMENPFWGNRCKIGSHEGQDVEMGYDIDYMTHIVWLGNEVITEHPALLLIGYDLDQNNADFKLGLDTLHIDLNSPDFKTLLRDFSAPLSRFTRSRFCNEFTVGSNSNANDTLRIRRIQEMDIPSGNLRRQAAAVKLANVLLGYGANSKSQFPNFNNDTVATNQTQTTIRKFSHLPWMQADVKTDMFFPVAFGDSLMTYCHRINHRYPSGSGSDSEEIYATINTLMGKMLTANNVFEKGILGDKKLQNLLIEGIIEEALNRGWLNYENCRSINNRQLTDSEAREQLKIQLLQLYTHTPRKTKTLDKAVHLANSIIEPNEFVALSPIGVVFNIDSSIFTHVDNSGYIPVTIPYHKIKKYLNIDMSRRIKTMKATR